MTARPRFLILGLEREAGPACLAQAAARGINVIAADTEAKLAALDSLPDAPPPSQRLALDFRHAAGALAAAQAAHAAAPFNRVFTYREFGLEAAAEIAAALGLPGNPPDVVRATRDKARLKSLLRSAGMLQPPSYVCHSVADAVSAYRAARAGRWIAKPCAQSGSLGVHIVESETELVRAAETILGLGAHERVLLEAFVSGPEFSVEGMVAGGRAHVFAVTEKTLFEGSFVERGHVLPAALPMPVLASIEEATVRALSAVGVRMGHFHVEVFLSPDGIVIGELHTRVGGDWIDLLLEHALDLEIYGLAFDQLLDRPLELDRIRPVRAAGVRFLDVPAGTVHAVAGLERARRVDGAVRIDVALQPGDRVSSRSSSSTRSGSVVVRAEHADLVKQRLDEIECMIQIETA